MTNLTTSRSSGRLCLAYRVGWEVVVMHISLGCFKLIQSVQSLCLGKWCQSSHCTDLCLSSCKHGRTMNSGDNIHFCSQRTDLLDGTSIRTLVVFQDHLTYSLLLILVYSLAKYSQPFFFICKSLFQLLSNLCHIVLSCLLVIREYCHFHFFWRNDLFDGCKKLFRNCTGLIRMLFFTTLCYDLIDEFDDLLIDFMCLVDGFDHLCFGNLIGSGLDHDHLVSCGSNCQLKVRHILLCKSRVDNKLSINQANLCGCTWTVKWNIGNTGSNGGAQHCRDLRIALRINRHNHIYQCNIISIILRKQRTHWTVNHTGSKDCMLTGLSLSLVESARDLPNSVHLLFIFYT